MERAQLIKLIKAAFPLRPVPGAGLYETHASDQLYMRYITEAEAKVATARDHGRIWTEYSDDELAGLTIALAHLVPEGFVYFLPAYLCAALRRLESHEDENSSDMLVTDTCFYVSSHDDYQQRRIRLFTADQRRAIVAFLESVAASDDFFNAPLARKALDRFWLRTPGST